MSLSVSARGSWSILAAALAVGAAVPAAFVRPPGRPPADRRIGQVEEGRPATLARHLERLKALPQNFGENVEGPGSAAEAAFQQRAYPEDRKSTRLNSSHVKISYAVFCLKKKKKQNNNERINFKLSKDMTISVFRRMRSGLR